MAVRRILQMENPDDLGVLRKRSSPVTKFDSELRKLVEDMIETMREADGVGLSAVQVGDLRRVVVMEMPGKYEQDEDGNQIEVSPPKLYVMINPEITKVSHDRIPMQEGCLSLPGRYAEVPRAPWVEVRYKDLNGKEHKLLAEEQLLSQCIQHEVDHLDGILFTERIVDWSTFRDERQKQKKSRFPLPRSKKIDLPDELLASRR